MGMDNSFLKALYRYARAWMRLKKQKKFETEFNGFSDKEIENYDAHLYEVRQNKPLDWNHLKTYTEKMQWAKFMIQTHEKSYVQINTQ